MMRRELVVALQSARPLCDLYSGYKHNDLEADPSVIRVATPRELGRLVAEACAGLGGPLTEEETEDIVLHEGQHGHAAVLLGAREVVYALGVIGMPRPDGSGTDDVRFIPMTRPQFAGPTFRLMDAAIAAYPTDPSPADRALIQNLGYDGVGAVAERILEINADFGMRLPVPLSQQPS